MNATTLSNQPVTNTQRTHSATPIATNPAPAHTVVAFFDLDGTLIKDRPTSPLRWRDSEPDL